MRKSAQTVIRPDAYYASVLRLLARVATADSQRQMVIASR